MEEKILKEQYTRQEIMVALSQLPDDEYEHMAYIYQILDKSLYKDVDEDYLRKQAEALRAIALNLELASDSVEKLISILDENRERKEAMEQKRNQDQNYPKSLMEYFHHTQWRSPWTI